MNYFLIYNGCKDLSENTHLLLPPGPYDQETIRLDDNSISELHEESFKPLFQMFSKIHIHGKEFRAYEHLSCGTFMALRHG